MPSPILPLAKLHLSASTALGAEEADILIAHLSPVPWSDLATKDDLAVLGRELRAEMAVSAAGLRAELAELRSDLRGEMADLRTEMIELRSELRGELRGEIGGLRAEMYRAMTAQTWRLVTAMVAVNGLLAAVVAAVR